VLTITQDAAAAIEAVVDSAPTDSEQAGLRIARRVSPDGQPGLELSVADAPAADDAIVASEGTPVFLDADAAQLLDDKVLDAKVEGGQVGFMLREQ
jgi:iron-sulfur cluster assembly protein